MGLKVNDTEYNWLVDENGFINFISDNKGNSFRIQNDGQTPAEYDYNTLLLSLCMARGIQGNEKPPKDPFEDGPINVNGVVVSMLDLPLDIVDAADRISNGTNEIVFFVPCFYNDGRLYTLCGDNDYHGIFMYPAPRFIYFYEKLGFSEYYSGANIFRSENGQGIMSVVEVNGTQAVKITRMYQNLGFGNFNFRETYKLGNKYMDFDKKIKYPNIAISIPPSRFKVLAFRAPSEEQANKIMLREL